MHLTRVPFATQRIEAFLLLQDIGFLQGVGMVLLAALALFAVMFLIGLPGRRRAQRLDASTFYGEALVRDVIAENVNSSGPRFVRYEVTISVSGRDPYDAHTSVLTAVTEIPALSIGQTFPVQVDPADPDHFRFVK